MSSIGAIEFSSSSDVWDLPLSNSAGVFFEEIGLALMQPMHWSSEFVARVLVYPLTPGKYGNLHEKILEIVRRCLTTGFHAILSPMTLPLYALGSLIRIGGEKIAKSPYYFIKGAKQPWQTDRFRVLTFNACMYWGGLPDHGGGISPARVRMDLLEKLLKRQDPDFLSLQEVSFGPGVALAHRLKDRYEFIYTNIGASAYHTTLRTGGPELFFASKMPILSEPVFIPYCLHSDKIGFFCIETPVAWIFSAHFPDGKEEMWPHRRALLEQVRQEMELREKTTGKPSIFTGDLNIRRTGEPSDEYAKSGVEKLYDPALQKYPIFNEDTATCTNAFLDFRLSQKDPLYEIDDYILCSPSFSKTHAITIALGADSYVKDHPELSISDHRYLCAEFRKNPQKSPN